MTSDLPTLLLVLADLMTVINAIHAYHIACQRMEWTGADVAKKQASAVHTIQRRLLQAYNRLDLGPTEREKLAAENRHLRDECNALLCTRCGCEGHTKSACNAGRPGATVAPPRTSSGVPSTPASI